MRISDSTIDQVRNANDIVDVVGLHVALKKRGKNYVGRCPFHTEKTPSFTVSAEKQVYHCFGCGKGGNVYTFIMELEKVSFVEAVRSLAERVGIAIEADQRADQEATENEQLYEACRAAGKFFYASLTEAGEGKAALEYLHGRGFTDETIRAFGLGYSPKAWDALAQHLKREKHDLSFFLKAGLLRTRDDGSVYDYFRGRAMFPIFSASGRALAFGARKLYEDDQLGKYINSPETPIYSKSRVLYGLFQAKEAIREGRNAIMVEGYADMVSLYQGGVRNVVASSGTALTAEQVQLVHRYADELTLVYDADAAGSGATLRGLDIALENGLDVHVVELPEGHDPDSFIRREGREAFRTYLDERRSFIEYKARRLLVKGSQSGPEQKASAVRSIVQSIAKIPDELKRNFFIKDVAQKFDLYESVLYRELEKWAPRTEPARPAPQRAQAIAHQTGPTPEDSSVALPAGEADILKLMLENTPEVVEYIFSEITLSDFHHAQARRLAEAILSVQTDTGVGDLPHLLDRLEDPALRGLVTDLALGKYQVSAGWGEREIEIHEADPFVVARGAIYGIKHEAIMRSIRDNLLKLKTAAVGSDEARHYSSIHLELQGRLKDLEASRREGTPSAGEAVPPQE